MVYIADTAVVDTYSKIFENARVEGTSYILSSFIRGNAQISGTAYVEASVICGGAQITGNTLLYRCKVDQEGRVYGSAKMENVNVLEASSVYGNAKLHNSSFYRIELRGSCKFGGNATFEGLKTLEDFVKKYGTDKVSTGTIAELSQSIRIILTDVWDMG